MVFVGNITFTMNAGSSNRLRGITARLKKTKYIGKAHFSLERVPSAKREVAQIYQRTVRGLSSTLQLNSR